MNQTDCADAATAKDWLKTQHPLAGRWVFFSVAISLIGGLLVIAQAWLLARTIDAVVFKDAGLADVRSWLWAIFGLFVSRAVLAWMAEQTAFAAAARVKLALRDQLLRHLMALGPVRLARERTGELSTTISDGVEALEAYFARYLPAMSLTVLLPLAILVVVMPMDWLAGVILLVTAPLIPLFMILIGKGAERLNQRQWRKLARLSAHFLDVIQGLTTLKLFNASRREIHNVARISDEYRHSTMAVLRVAFLSSLALEFFATVSIAVVAVSIGFRLFWGEMEFLYGFFILLLAPEFYLPLRAMGTHYHARMEAIGAAERLLHILSLPTPNTPEGTAETPSAREAIIEFDRVGVTYPGEIQALRELDLKIRPGERIAIVGPSGAGKTTLMNLLLGFIEPSQGQIRIAGQDLQALDLAAWREQLAWVPQRPHLFAGTLADNIRLGAPHASDAELRQAASLAGLDLVGDLPLGLDTPLGEHGIGLSGGQVQRVALARAFVRKAPLTLLDEPTTSLDKDTEAIVQQAMEGLAGQGTVIVIAHRLNTVRQAERILLIDQGRLVGEGTHESLLSDSPIYRRLVADFGEGA